MKLSRKTLNKLLVVPLTSALVLGLSGCACTNEKMTEETAVETPETEVAEETVEVEATEEAEEENKWHAIVIMKDTIIDYEIIDWNTYCVTDTTINYDYIGKTGSKVARTLDSFYLTLSDGSLLIVPMDNTIIMTNEEYETNKYLLELAEEQKNEFSEKQKEMTR